jgi:hypothetical protein
LNNAFGSVSTTTAMTSIASSFDKQSPSMKPGGPHLLSFPVGLLRGLLMAFLQATQTGLRLREQEDGGGRDTHHLQVYPMRQILGRYLAQKEQNQQKGRG